MFFHEELIFASDGHSNYRIPSLIVTNDGTVLAFCNDRRDTLKDHATDIALVYARKESGKAWEGPTTLMEYRGISCIIGSAVHDAMTDTSFVFVQPRIARDEFGKFSDADLERFKEEDAQYAATLGIEISDYQFLSTDSGKSWTLEKQQVTPYAFTHINGKEISASICTHGCAHGVQLRHGAHPGRLLCPSRIFAGRYENWTEIINCVYNNAVYSDDHGKSWRVSAPVQLGTGEGTLIELGNGEILYNSRAFFGDGKRYLATSTDGGETYGNFTTDDFLFETKRIGCNASFLRVERDELGEELAAKYLPKGSDSITLFVNPRANARSNMTVCVSFDSARSWQITKTVYEGPCAYSSLDFSRADKRFYLLYEKGIEKPNSLGIAAAEFDLEWLLS